MPYCYAQVDGSTNKVHTVQEMPNRLVEIDEMDHRLLGTIYDHETGEFIGFHISLSSDKSQIAVGAEDTTDIIASITTWDDQVGSAFTGDILFEVNEQQVPVTAVDGHASFEFASNETGVFEIKTVNTEDTVLSNGSIEIEVIDIGE